MAPGHPPSSDGFSLSPCQSSCFVPVTMPAAVPNSTSLFPVRCRDLPPTAVAAVGRNTRPPTFASQGTTARHARPALAWAWVPGHDKRPLTAVSSAGAGTDTPIPRRAGVTYGAQVAGEGAVGTIRTSLYLVPLLVFSDNALHRTAALHLRWPQSHSRPHTSRALALPRTGTPGDSWDCGNGQKTSLFLLCSEVYLQHSAAVWIS